MPLNLEIRTGPQGDRLLYFHTEAYHETVPQGAQTGLKNMAWPDGPVSVTFYHPGTCSQETAESEIIEGELRLTLPSFYEDIAIKITRT